MNNNMDEQSAYQLACRIHPDDLPAVLAELFSRARATHSAQAHVYEPATRLFPGLLDWETRALVRVLADLRENVSDPDAYAVVGRLCHIASCVLGATVESYLTSLKQRNVKTRSGAYGPEAPHWDCEVVPVPPSTSG